jgi:hypothetical protein
MLARTLPAWLRATLARCAGRNRPLPAWLGARLAWYPQKLEERRQRAERRLLLDQDERAERRLSFAGRGE